MRILVKSKVVLAVFLTTIIAGAALTEFLVPARVFAQTVSESPNSPAFQSVTITRSNSSSPLARISTQDGAANFTGYSLQELIKYAYGPTDPQIVGGPAWVASIKYDIKAQGPGGNVFTLEQMRLAVEKLLADRFGLVIHREERKLNVYELTVAADGMKLGEPQLGGGLYQSKLLFSAGHADASGITMSTFAQGLATPVGAFVIDKTGMSGAYDFSLDWPSSRNVAESISAALKQQLGLQLNRATTPVEVFVIDHVEDPNPIPIARRAEI